MPQIRITLLRVQKSNVNNIQYYVKTIVNINTVIRFKSCKNHIKNGIEKKLLEKLIDKNLNK